MPRKPREKSISGIYHIILRGINRQEIFYDTEDNVKFLNLLDNYKRISDLKVFAWCLMGNHVHLLLHEGTEDISTTIKRIGVSYAWYFNNKYKASGHLFQDRYRSENVKDDRYLLTVIRYIHQNPVKAGMVKNIRDWKWSSYLSYNIEENNIIGILDREYILRMFSNNNTQSVDLFMEFNEIINDDFHLEINENKYRLNDSEAIQEISKLISCCNVMEIKWLPRAMRDLVINDVKKIEGISKRQISRVLGIPKNQIFRT